VKFGKANPRTSVLVLSPAAGTVPHAEILARFDRCVAANGKTLGALPDKTGTITTGLFDSPYGNLQALGVVAALLALVLCLPTRRVRVTVDRQSRTIRIREQGLFQRAAVQELSIDELLDVALEDAPGANTAHIVVRRTQGSPVRLFASDLRPIELQRRTAKRLGAWLAAARARD
jgi:hypothetical protein